LLIEVGTVSLLGTSLIAASVSKWS
jgi:hypothetical protein